MLLQNLNIKTGDVYLGSGTAKSSYLTRWITKSVFSHSGLLWQNNNKILTYETYKPNLCEPADYLTGLRGKGTQSVLFQDRLNSYAGNIWLLRLKSEFEDYRPIIHNLIINGNYRRSFCSSWFKLAAAGFKLSIAFNAGRTFFCSELVLTVYRDAGILPKSVEPWRFTPVDLVRHFGYLFEDAVLIKVK